MPVVSIDVVVVLCTYRCGAYALFVSTGWAMREALKSGASNSMQGFTLFFYVLKDFYENK